MCAGVSDNRLQNVVITLDKVKLCLERPGQPPPPLQMSPLPAHAVHHMQSSLHVEKKRQDYVLGVALLRSQVLYRAAQAVKPAHCI